MVHRRQVVIDYVHDVAHVDATSRDSSGNQNRRGASTERPHGRLAVKLGPITVDGGDWQLHVEQEIVQTINFLAAVGKDDGANAVHLIQQLEKKVSLLMGLRLHDKLLDVFRGAASAANAEADVSSGQVVLGQVTSFLGKGGREQAVFDVALILVWNGQSSSQTGQKTKTKTYRRRA